MKSIRWLSAGLVLCVVVVAALWLRRGASDRPLAATRGEPSTVSTAHAPVSTVAGQGSVASQSAALPGIPAAGTASPLERWAARFQAAAAPAAQAALLAEGKQLARERRVEMARLIEADPEEAIRRALPHRVRRQLPGSIQSLIEQPVSGRGELKPIFYTPLPGREREVPPTEYHVAMGRTDYRAYPYGRRLSAPAESGAALHGVALLNLEGRTEPDKNILALSSDAVRFVEPEEAAELIISGAAKAEGNCAVCAEPAHPAAAPAQGGKTAVLADHGGFYLPVCCAAHGQTLNRQLSGQSEGRIWGSSGGSSAAPAGSGGAAPSFFFGGGTQGLKRLLYIIALFADDPRPPQSENGAQATADDNSQFFQDGSYGTVAFHTTVTPPVRLPQPRLFYGENQGFLLNHAIAAAQAQGIFSSDYDHVYVLFTSVPQFNFGGRSDGLLNASPGALSHELGHNFGLPHANYWNVSGNDPGPTNRPALPTDPESLIGHDDINATYIFNLKQLEVPIEEYGNPYDVMGSGGGHFSAYFKNQMNWLPEEFVVDIRRSTTNRIYAFDTPRVSQGRSYAMRFHKDFGFGFSFGVGRQYWISHRQGFPNNPWLANGLVLDWPGNGLLMLDTTPTTAPRKQDVAVVVGRTFTDPAAHFHLTPIARGGTNSDAWIDVVTHVGPFPTNLPPTMTLAASATTVSNGATITFIATAQDANGDALAYNWDFGDYSFGFNSATNVKTFPATGHYVVRCEASDMRGGVASAHVLVIVGSPATFTLSGRVMDTLGLPVQGARVHTGGTPPAVNVGPPGSPANPPPSGSGDYRYSYTDSEGYYIIGNVPAGTYDICRAFKFGYRTDPQFFEPVEVLGSDVANLDHLANPLPKVSITRLFDAGEPATEGVLRVSRAGDYSQELPVQFFVSGSAQPGTHYEWFPGNYTTNIMVDTNTMPPTTNFIPVPSSVGLLTIPAGAAFVDLVVRPIDDFSGDGQEKVTVTLWPQTTERRMVTILTNVLVTNIVVVATNMPPTTNTVVTTNGYFTNVVVQFRIPGWEPLPVGPDSTLTWFQTYPTYVMAGAEASLTIAEDEPVGLPTVTLFTQDSVAMETRGDSATLVLVRNGTPLDATLTVYFAPGLFGGTAEYEVDYQTLPASVTFPAGVDRVIVPVTAINDLFVEATEYAEVYLLPDAAYNIGSGFASIQIVDDDLPLVSVYASDSIASRTGNTGQFTVGRTGSADEDLLVNYLVSGTAVAGADYPILSGSVIIPAGEFIAAVTIAPLVNPASTGVKTVTLLLSDSPAYNIAFLNTATVTIQEDVPVVTLTRSTDTIGENGGSGSFTVTRTGDPTNNVLVFFEVGGSAVEGADYAAIGTNILIPAGSASANIVITAIDDVFREFGDESGDENVIVQLVSGPGYNVGNPSGQRMTIDDNEPDTALPAVGFMLRNSSGREDDGQALIAVKLSANPATNKEPVYVDYRIVGGSAVPGVNYLPISGVTGLLTFAHYEAPDPDTDPFFNAEGGVEFIPISILDDFLAAGNKTFTLRLFNPNRFITTTSVVTNGGMTFTNVLITKAPTNAFLGDYNQHTFTILDVGLPAVSINVLEFSSVAYEAGSVAARMEIFRTGPMTSPLSVALTTQGTAAEGNDYARLTTNGLVTIPAGTNRVLVNLTPLDDPEEESIESIIVRLVERPGYKLGSPAQAFVSIVSDDGTIQFTVASPHAAENAGPAVIGVQRTGNTNLAVTVEFRTFPGTATSGLDFVPTNGVLSFAPGEIFKNFSVPLLDEGLVEAAETVSLVLTNPTGGVPLGGQRTATLFIDNDDSAFTFAANAYSVDENGGSAQIVVERGGVTVAPADIVFRTRDGSARATNDYVGTNVTLTFAAGVTSQVVQILIVDDSQFEIDETVNLSLDTPGGGAVLGALTNSILFIREDESTLEFVQAATSLNESAGTGLITVRRNGGTVNSVSVTYGARDGTASNTVDFAAVSGQLTFAGNAFVLDTNGSGALVFQPGETVKTIAVPILDDVLGEGIETFTLFLTNATGAGAALGALTNSIVTILDNETPGGLEIEYNSGSGANDSVRAVALQSERAVFAGDFTLVNGIGLNRVARLTVTGSVDPGFNPGAGANASVFAIAVQPDGRVILGGDFTLVDGTNRLRVARLNADGNLDLSFNVGAGANGLVRAAAVQIDGRILIGGDFTQVAGSPRNRLARLHTDGTLDGSFNPNVNGPVHALAVQSDGRVLLGGTFATVGGVPRLGLARVTSAGAVDGGFNAGANAAVNALALQADGRLVIGGAFSAINGMVRNFLARLNPDGLVDETFTTGTGPNGPVNAVSAHAGGKIGIGGDFTSFNGVSRNNFARLRPTGGLDTLFAIGAGANAAVLATVVQSNTAVIIGGEFTAVDGVPRGRIARLHGDELSTITSVDFASISFPVVEDAGFAVITIQRGGQTNRAFDVEFRTLTGTASNGLDYSGLTQTVSFASGDLTKTVSVPILNDMLFEVDETVGLLLTNVTPGIDANGQVSATLRIVDDEKGLQFSLADYAVGEAETNAAITVLRSGLLTGTVTVQFRAMDGSASAGSDYTGMTNTITFTNGESTRVVLVPIVNDNRGENDETVLLELAAPNGATLVAPFLATLTIVEDDQTYGTFNFSSTNRIQIVDGGPAIPYPSTIVVADLTGVVSRVAVSLMGLTHTFPDDIDVMLVGPSGQSVLFLSDAGGPLDVNNLTLRFEDRAAALPDNGLLVSGTNGPSVFEGAGDAFLFPAPGSPYATNFGSFLGGQPNGAWSLYVLDDRGGDTGEIRNGWRLHLTTVNPATTNDLAIGMADAPDPVTAGQTITYSISVTNLGPLLATNVMVTNPLPANVAFLGATPSQGACSNAGGAIVCSLGTLAAGATAQIALDLRPFAAGALINSASVSSRLSDVVPDNDVATATTTVNSAPVADLTLGMTDAPDPVFAGLSLIYSIAVTNRGPLAATGVTVLDALPENTEFVTATVSQGTFQHTAGLVTLNLGSLGVGAVATATITVRPRSAGLLTNSVTASAAQLDLDPVNRATTVTTVNPAANLVLTMDDVPDPVPIGGRVFYNLTILNTGPSTATSVTLFDTLPAQLPFVSASSPQGSNFVAGNTVVFALGTISNGMSVTVTIVARAPLPGVFTNRASVIAAQEDGNLADNSATEDTTASGQITSGIGLISNGTVLLGVHPEGHLNVPSNIRSSGSGPGTGTTFVGLRYVPTGAESTAPGCLCEGWGVADALAMVSGGANEAIDAGAFGLSVESFEEDGVSATSVVRVHGRLSTNATPTFRVTHFYHPSIVSNLYQVDVTVENISTREVEVLYRRVMDWDIEPTPFQEFSTMIKGNSPNLVYTSDNGFASADPLFGPSQILATGTFVDSGPADHGALFDFNFGRLAPGQSTFFRTYYGAAGSESQANLAVASIGAEAFSYGQPSTEGGSTLGTPNTFIFAFGGIGGSVLVGADVSVAMTATPSPVVLGDPLTYTLVVSNNGPETATGVIVTDRLPAQGSLISRMTTQGTVSDAGGIVTANLGSLAKNASARVTIVVLPNTETILTNSASVVANQPDGNSLNNAATELTAVVVLGTFINRDGFFIGDGAPAIPYPSVIHVSGLSGLITNLTASLVELSHSFPADLDVLLVGPQGESVLLMSDAGQGGDINAVTLRFEDGAVGSLPAAGQILSGIYKPTNVGSNDVFLAPAPGGPFGDALSVFHDTNPNGDWLLYIMDDQGADTGALNGGWRLTISTDTAAAPRLTIALEGNEIVLSWPASAAGYAVEYRNTLVAPGVPGGWAPVMGTPVLNGSRYEQRVPLGAGARFFRLIRP